MVLVYMSVCLCVFFPFILDIKFVGRTSRGHTIVLYVTLLVYFLAYGHKKAVGCCPKCIPGSAVQAQHCCSRSSTVVESTVVLQQRCSKWHL